MTARDDSRGDRYEPLPPIPQLPRWIWRKLPRPAKVAVALLPVAAIVLIVVLAPGIDRSKDERSRSEQQQLDARQAQRLRRLRAEQRPRVGRATALAPVGASSAKQLAGRGRALAQLATSIQHDARTRGLAGPIGRVECEAYPRTVAPSGAELDLGRRTGRYACIAVTADVKPTATQGSGIIGHPYRALLDFTTGGYAFCKISGRPGEQAIPGSVPTGVPRVCGGG